MLNAHADLLAAQEVVYSPLGFVICHFKVEEESQEYAACDFEMNHMRIKFRVAKITPTKNGQFVTLWKRRGKGPILPFDLADPIDLVIVSVRSAQHLGQFVFPKEILVKKGILSKGGKGGKRAMRVYPPWDKAESDQAKKTQQWQCVYFFEINSFCVDHLSIQKLFSPIHHI